MSNSNSDNPKIGRLFQEKVRAWFEKDRGASFVLEPAISIGNPAKSHKFDIANEARTTVIECKCYKWTDTDNIPSAKLRALNEAVFYFSFLPANIEKILVMTRAVNIKGTSLAEHYFNTNGHLLGDVKLWEFNVDTEEMRIIKND